MTYSAAPLGSATIELQCPAAGLPNVLIRELAGESSYARTIINTQRSNGRTAGNVTRVSGFRQAWRHYAWDLVVRLDPTRAAIVLAMWGWQQDQINADIPSPVTLIDRYKRTEFRPDSPYQLEPDSIEELAGMQRGFPAVPVLLEIGDEDPETWVARTMIDLRIRAVEMR